MRLIDADALVKQIESPYTEYSIMIHLRRAIKDFIDSAPTIDAIEVVRCKDCIWFNKGENEVDSWTSCTAFAGVYLHVDDDHFCSHGERREP